MKRLRVDVWSDIACPWCYVGKRRLEAALKKLPFADEVEVVWRAFELDPAAPAERPTAKSYAARLGEKYGTSESAANGMIARMTDVAKEDGLDFRFDRIRPGNTFDAHRLLHLAKERGVQDAVKERFLRAYMTEGEPIGSKEALASLAVSAGVDADEVSTLLAGDQFAKEVREDETEATELGIRGVPFFVIAGKYAVSGAQPADVLQGALARAWKEIEASPLTAYGEGAVCGPEGCA
jgi:predicted DsbA family dithiol-disulfide isomerase